MPETPYRTTVELVATFDAQCAACNAHGPFEIVTSADVEGVLAPAADGNAMRLRVSGTMRPVVVKCLACKTTIKFDPAEVRDVSDENDPPSRPDDTAA